MKDQTLASLGLLEVTLRNILHNSIIIYLPPSSHPAGSLAQNKHCFHWHTFCNYLDRISEQRELRIKVIPLQSILAVIKIQLAEKKIYNVIDIT